ncbi:ZZ-type zinc finger-containing protein 3 isoform X1 [Daphnia magna]|uniref:ZZ-type zinc finger-containing protein 3 n=2 Tax=Daphnia magna TaxID=35525 RepID=A0ABR0A7P9_9CRUS|nr:ZZ-type zinc finger-containing protein 3 isoform X1 [Daphnia magna]KAK4021162.1 hypothetical protein OUZ56_003085 [Daphnia magna]
MAEGMEGKNDDGLKDNENVGWAEENLDSFGEYCFETDQLALKGNADYQALLRTLAVLEGQRMIAVQNMEKIIPLKKEALESPLTFIEKLQRGENMDFPQPQVIAEIPEINWSKYGVVIPENLEEKNTENPKPLSTNNSDSESKETDRGKDGKLLVRGREFNQRKPETFNQLWTPEEQKRLEELLVIHPPEQVEMERFRKIARALGNRTPLQVQSRVQKYFIKLQKAGLPVPGRTYNFTQYSNNRKSGHRHQRNNRFLFPSSTFFASATPPVYMNDVDDSSELFNEPSPAPKHEDIQVSDEDVPDSVKISEGYSELMWLKLMKRIKSKQNHLGVMTHYGYRCDHCGLDPISGTRWHCFLCPSNVSTDMCEKCAFQLASKGGYHQPNHKMIPILKAEPLPRQGPNYLQPNFMTEN